MTKFKILLLFIIAYSIDSFSQNIHNQTLPEIIVKNNTKIEKADKIVLIPTKLERKHTANAID